MSEGRRRGPPPKPVKVDWNMCCLAIGFHRFDCTKVAPKYRAPGPYLPTTDQAREE